MKTKVIYGSFTVTPEGGGPMKVRKSLRALKKTPGAQVVRRRGTVFVINEKDPRGKARQG